MRRLGLRVYRASRHIMACICSTSTSLPVGVPTLVVTCIVKVHVLRISRFVLDNAESCSPKSQTHDHDSRFYSPQTVLEPHVSLMRKDISFNMLKGFHGLRSVKPKPLYNPQKPIVWGILEGRGRVMIAQTGYKKQDGIASLEQR